MMFQLFNVIKFTYAACDFVPAQVQTLHYSSTLKCLLKQPLPIDDYSLRLLIAPSVLLR